jgi:hypothetical protein
MKKAALTAILFFVAADSINLANATESTPTKLEIFESAKGDLNQDGIDDEVITKTECGDCFDWDNEAPPKKIVEVYLSDAQSKTLKLSEVSEGALCYLCGGVKGGKIIGTPEITKKGVLTFLYSGGSRLMWDDQFKWRLNKTTKKLELIGRTLKNTDTLSENGTWDPDDVDAIIFEDVNFASGKGIIKKMGSKKKVVTVKCKVSKDLKLPNFSTFDFVKFAEEAGSDFCKP